MLSDLLQLEEFYGHPACAAFFEDISKRYGERNVQQALRAGDVCMKRFFCAHNQSRALVWLSPQGRKKAQV